MQDLFQGKEEKSRAGRPQRPPSLPPEGAPGLAQPRPGPALQALAHAPLQPPGLCSQTPPTPFLDLLSKGILSPSRLGPTVQISVRSPKCCCLVSSFSSELLCRPGPCASPSILFQSPMRPGTARESTQDRQGWNNRMMAEHRARPPV